MMSELEFDIMDELYFAIPFSELKNHFPTIEKAHLAELLWEMVKKEWVKVLKEPDEELEPDESEYRRMFENYHYIASKKGLLLHNSR